MSDVVDRLLFVMVAKSFHESSFAGICDDGLDSLMDSFMDWGLVQSRGRVRGRVRFFYFILHLQV